jgi:UDP-glucose 4-epimerase
VTGGAGFIGASVVRALVALGDEVVVLDSGIAAGFGYITGTGARLVEADVRDVAALELALAGCSAVVHLAAQPSVPHSIAEPLADISVNLDGSLRLLDAARREGIRRFVFASSNASIGGHRPPARESLPADPVSPYGAAKAATEAYLRAYAHAYGMETVALRFANAFGPWSGHKSSVVAAFIRAYLGGGPLIIRGNGAQTRDFVHSDDVSSAVLAGLDAPGSRVAGEVFQVGTGRETSLVELARLLFTAGGHEVGITFEEAAPGDVPRNVSDIEKARRVLGYAPRVELGEGLRQTLGWFRDNWRS